MLADTPATRRAAEKTERNIRPQSGGKRKQRVRIQRAVVHRIQSAKHGGRISAAASQPRADGNAFGNIDPHAAGQARSCKKGARGLIGDVVLRIAVKPGAGDLDRCTCTECYNIAERDAVHHRINVMVTVCPSSADLKSEVELGICKQLHFSLWTKRAIRSRAFSI